MHFTTGGGLPEAAIYGQRTQPAAKEYCNAELSFTFSEAKRSRKRLQHAPLLASVTLARSRGHRGAARSLLASLTGFALFQGRDAGLRRTFNSIDVDGKGHINEKDLESFAARNGLPSSYAAHFASAVRANASKKAAATATTASREGTAGGQQQPQSRPGRREVEETEEDAELTFGMFRQFVRSREEALRRAFDLFDQDGDGRISVDDLDSSLSRVAVCCPQTRCIYRCPARMAHRLHSTVAAERRFLGFQEFRDFFLLLPQQDMLVEYWVAAGAAGGELSDKVSLNRAAAAAADGAAGGGKGASAWGHLLAGAVAGATSRTATAPLETLRLAAMAGQLQSRTLAQAASDIVSSQGWQGLYRGNLLNVMRSAPQKALDFFVFDAFKRLLGDDTHLQTFLAAGLAGCTSWIALYPLEVVRSRITVSAAAASHRALAAAASAAAAASSTAPAVALASSSSAAAAAQSNLLTALTSIIRNEGPAALYKGLGPSVAAIFPEAAITYGLHDALKKAYTRALHREPGVVPSLAFGVLSAFMGQLVSFPLETVSRRLQVAAVGPPAVAGASAATGGGLGAATAVLRGLLAEGGPAALYRGIGAATLRLVPMAVVSFGTYEAVRALIVAWEQQQEEQQVKAMLHSRCVPLVLQGPNGGQEVVGRLCTPPGAQTPSLCGATGPGRCGPGGAGSDLGLQLEPVGVGAPPDLAGAALSVEPEKAVAVAGPAVGAAVAAVGIDAGGASCPCPGTTVEPAAPAAFVAEMGTPSSPLPCGASACEVAGGAQQLPRATALAAGGRCGGGTVPNGCRTTIAALSG